MVFYVRLSEAESTSRFLLKQRAGFSVWYHGNLTGFSLVESDNEYVLAWIAMYQVFVFPQ